MGRLLAINPNQFNRACDTVNTREREEFIGSICARCDFPRPYQIYVHLLPWGGSDLPGCQMTPALIIDLVTLVGFASKGIYKFL